ncbi:beta-1,3-galactosyltransferase 2-like [Ambystoma mexicanum]|uniref:beta-1,3-galactosyltransferase 2-like n=1 Tax=Ambystoma mexicanum TaxID=8296 RepID=UPI0037E94672
MLQCGMDLWHITRNRWIPKPRLRVHRIGMVLVFFAIAFLFCYQYEWFLKRSPISADKMASLIQEYWPEEIKTNFRSNLSLSPLATATEFAPAQPTGLRNTVGAHPNNSTRSPTSIQFRFIINEADKCQKDHPFLILLVPSEPSLVQARQVIRQTWGNERLVPGIRIVRIFLLGITTQPESKLQQDIFEESRQYHDIVQHEYLDSYRNLTIKTLMGLNWVATFCPNTTYVMKADCDMFVNTEYLIHYLLKPDQPPRHIYFTGHLIDAGPDRDNSSKWYMPPEIYPDRRYPTFCSGTGYVFSGDLAAKIFAVSFSVKKLHLEDVYVALCLKALNVTPEAPPRKSDFNHWHIPFSICHYSRLITSHGFQPDELLKHWSIFQQGKGNCVSME